MKTFQKLGLMVVCASLAACSGNTLVDDPGEDGGVLTFQVLHHATPNDLGEFPDYLQQDLSKVFQNDLGITIRLNRAALSWGHINLSSSGEHPECQDGQEAELHIEYVENILDEDRRPRELSEENIEKVAYCSYHLEFMPGEEGTPGFDEVPEILEHSALVQGTWSNGMQSGDFSIALSGETTVEGVFKGQEGELHPLHFHDGEDSKVLILGSAYDRWFDGIDFSETPSELEAKLSENIKDALRQFTGETLESESIGGSHH